MSQSSIKKNTIYNGLKTLSAVIFPLITFPYISRTLLPENVGKINFGLSIVAYFSLIASLGITTYAIRECSAVRNDENNLTNTASQIFSINIITTLVAYVALGLTLIFYRKLENYRVLIFIQSLSIVTTTLGADWLNSAMEDFRFITIRTISFQFISLMLMFVFVHNPSDYMKYVVISLISSAGANVANIWHRRKYCNLKIYRRVIHCIEWKKHMMPIVYLFVLILAQTIFHNVDSTMLGLQIGDREVGIYSTAHKVFNLINQVVASLILVIIPRMSLYFEKGDYSLINKMLKKVIGFNTAVGLPCVVGVTALSEEIIIIMAGQDYIDAAPVLKILMLGFLFMLFGGNFLGNAILLPSKQEKYFMIVCCITAVVNIITNYIFIPIWGAKAAAGTTALSELVILLLLLAKKDRRIQIEHFHDVLVSPIIGCICISMICLWAKGIANIWIRTIISIVLSALAYGIVLIILKNPLANELLKGLKGKIERECNQD